jgi:hypothetical protein
MSQFLGFHDDQKKKKKKKEENKQVARVAPVRKQAAPMMAYTLGSMHSAWFLHVSKA